MILKIAPELEEYSLSISMTIGLWSSVWSV
jgi:hypothetical protein